MFSPLMANRFGSLAAFVYFKMQSACRGAGETVAMHSDRAWMVGRDAHMPRGLGFSRAAAHAVARGRGCVGSGGSKEPAWRADEDS